MIRLSVEDYCHNCPEFEIDIKVDTTTFHGHNMITGDSVVETQINRVIRCKHKERCRAIANHISKKFSKG